MAERPFAEVLGDPVDHSLSPIIHGFWARALGLEVDYVATRVPLLELGGHLAARRHNPLWRGASVTVPLKERALALVDRAEPTARRIGAVNTLVPRDGALVGANTDWLGFMGPVARLCPPGPATRSAVLLGAGGAARAIGHALGQAGWSLVIVNRSLDRAHRLATDLVTQDERHPDQVHALPWPHKPRLDWPAPVGHHNLLVQATSLGMEGQPPLDLALGDMPDGLIVVDIVYQPLTTDLLRDARVRGFRTIDGLEMLVGQAAGGFERFFAVAPPRGRDEELRAMLAAACGA